MKRKIALALSAFVALSMCSCTSETSGTRTTRHTKETTEETETEPTETTEEPSSSTEETTKETTEATTEETTEETTGSSSASESTSESTTEETTTGETTEGSTTETTTKQSPPDPNVFTVDNTVRLIPKFYVAQEVRVYGTNVAYHDKAATAYVSCVYENIGIASKGFEAVADAIELDSLAPTGDCFTGYILARNDFIVQQHEDPLKLMNHIFRFEFFPTRHDDQIVSYLFTEGSFDNYAHDLKGSSFDAMTGERITFEDVVTDKDALIAYLYKAVDPSRIDNEFEAMLDTIKDGTVTFALNYNSLILNPKRKAIILSAPDHSDFLNMHYFGAAPENYALLFDSYGQNVTWDFDGNGTLDTVRYTSADDRHFELKSVELDYNGRKSELSLQELPNGAYSDNMFIIYDGTDFYLYIRYNYEDDIDNAYVVKIDANGLTYIGDLSDFTPYRDFWIDPACLRLEKHSGVIGALTSHDVYSLVDGQGLPNRLTDYADFSLDLDTFFTIKKDLHVTKLDDTFTPVGDITVPADSTVYLMRYYKEKGQIMFKCLFENDYEDFYFLCDCREDFENWDTYIGGIEIEDLFYDEIYYGV